MLNQNIYLREGRTDVYLSTFIREPLHIFDGKGVTIEAPRPAVIVCPGGGYGFCSPNESDPVAVRFLSMGYHAFVLHYSVHSTAGEHDVSWPQPFLDLGAAMLTIRDHAQEWNIDPEQIAVCGFSAGGHLAGMLATNWHNPQLAEHFGRPSIDFKPTAALLIYPALHAVKYLLGAGSNTALLELADHHGLDPAYLVDEKTCPIFMCHAQNDHTVPATETLEMAQALQQKEIPYSLHMFEEGSHGFVLADENSSSLQLELHEDNREWARLAQMWLRKHVTINISDFRPTFR